MFGIWLNKNILKYLKLFGKSQKCQVISKSTYNILCLTQVSQSMKMCVWVSVCVCVRARMIERERENEAMGFLTIFRNFIYKNKLKNYFWKIIISIINIYQVQVQLYTQVDSKDRYSRWLSNAKIIWHEFS